MPSDRICRDWCACADDRELLVCLAVGPLALLSKPDEKVGVFGVMPWRVVICEHLLLALRQESRRPSRPFTAAPQVVMTNEQRKSAPCESNLLGKCDAGRVCAL